MLGEAVLRTPMSRPVYRRLLRQGLSPAAAAAAPDDLLYALRFGPAGHLQPQVARCVRAHAVLVVAVRSLSARSCRPGAAEAIPDAALADGHAHNDMWWQPE
jgi:hypothetical protein